MKKIKKELIWLIIAYAWCMVGSTIVNYFMGNKLNLSQAILDFCTICGVILLSDIGLTKNPRLFLQAFSITGSVMCVLNALTFFVYANKGGMNPAVVDALTGRKLSSNYFLFAEDNATFFWVWPVFVIMWLNLFLYNRKRSCNKKRRGYAVWVVCATLLIVASYVYVWSVTAMLIFAVMGAAVFVHLWRIRKMKSSQGRLSKLINSGRYSLFHILFLVSIVITVLIVGCQIYLNFANFMEVYLKKTVTLSSRTAIWDNAIYYIKESFLVGYGYEAREVSFIKLARLNHTHNLWLEIFYRGGVIGAVLFFIALWLCGEEKHSKEVVWDKEKRANLNFVYFSIFLFFLSTIFEFAFYRYMYVVLFVVLMHKDIFYNIKEC